MDVDRPVDNMTFENRVLDPREVLKRDELLRNHHLRVTIVFNSFVNILAPL